MTSLVRSLARGGVHSRLRGLGDSIGLRRLMDSPPPVATSQALSLIGGLFYLSGGLVTIVTAVAQRDTGRHSELILLVGFAAVLTGLVLTRFADFISLPARRSMNFVGTGLILLVLLLAGDAGGHPLYWLFCYVPLDAFLFFPWRWALPMFGWLLSATAIATFGMHVTTTAEWFVIVVVASVAAFAIGWLGSSPRTACGMSARTCSTAGASNAT